MIDKYENFEFYLDTEKAQKHYFFNSHVTRGCFKKSELEYFYHQPIAQYLRKKLEEGKLPERTLYICFDHKIQQENFFVWQISAIIDDQELHELYKLSNLKLYYRILMPEEEFLQEEPLTVEVVDH